MRSKFDNFVANFSSNPEDIEALKYALKSVLYEHEEAAEEKKAAKM